MTGNARQFSLEIDREFAEVVEGGILRTVQAISLELEEGVKKRTPVKDGYARASWHGSVGSPQFIPFPGPGNVSAILGMTEVAVVYVTNSAEYISRLENGSSKQAPQGMVALTIAELESKYRRVE